MSSSQLFDDEEPTVATTAKAEPEAEDQTPEAADPTADSAEPGVESEAVNASEPEATAAAEPADTSDAAKADETETSPPKRDASPATETGKVEAAGGGTAAAAGNPSARKRAKSAPAVEPEIEFISGFLMKKGDWGFRWAKRYFEVHVDGTLKYFMEQKKEGAAPKGQFPLLDSTVSNTTIKKKDWTFEIKMKDKKKPIVLAAADEGERQRWVEAMSDFREARKKKVLEHMSTTEVPFYEGPMGLKLGVSSKKYSFLTVVKVEAVMENTQACNFDLVENDLLLKVNDTFVEGKKYPEVIKLLKSQMRPMTLTFGRWKTIVPAPEAEANAEEAAAAEPKPEGAEPAVSALDVPDEEDAKASDDVKSPVVSPSAKQKDQTWMDALYERVHDEEEPLPTKEEFDAFLSAHASQQFECTVSDPEEHKDNIVTKKFVRFRIITRLANDEMWSVTRRFSDFVQLRDVLCARYVGLFIPKLRRTRAELTLKNTVAALKMRKKGNEEYIQNRMRGLGEFLNRITALPYLRSDVTVTDFLREQDRKQFETLIGKKTGFDALTKGLKKTTGVTDRANKSHEMWIYACNTSVVPKNSQRLIEDLKKQLMNQQKALRAVIKSCEAMKQQLEDRAAAYGRFAEITQKLQDLEIRMGDPDKNEFTQSMSPEIVSTMESTNQIVAGWHSSALLSGPIFHVTVTSHFQQCLIETEGMLDMVKERERLAVSARRSTNNHTKLQAKRKAGQPDENLERKITEMDRLQKLQHFCVEFMTKGLINHSIAALRKRRKRAFLECAIQWASSQGTHLDKELATADAAMTKIAVDPTATRQSLVQILRRAKDLFLGEVFDTVIADLEADLKPSEE